MNLWHLVFRTDSLTYTICRALRECGYEVAVWVVDPEFGVRPEDGIQRRLAATAGVRLVGRNVDELPAMIDRLLIQSFPRPFETVRDVPLLAQRAKSITLISAGDRSRRLSEALKLQRLEMRSLGRLWQRVDRVLYKDGPHRADLFALRRRRSVVGFDAHSQFLHDSTLFDLIHAEDWTPGTLRPLLANFLGSRDPASRGAVLDSVRHLFVAPSGEPRVPRPGKAMSWHEYPDANPVGLPTKQFIDTLTRSDFTLCPRGYSLVTHRPIEALLRGSIPVLASDEADLYGFGLIDGVNCITVRAGRWAEAVERISELSDGKIVRLRENVRDLRTTVLDYRLLAARICDRLGVEVQPASASGTSPRSLSLTESQTPLAEQ
jgi:hypothetical protein